MSFPLLGNPKPTFLDSSGNPLASGTLAVLDPADDTNKASYPTADDADAATNANANPLTLDARGEPATGLFGIDNETYKLVLKDSAGVTIWTQDDIKLPAGSAAKIGSLLYPTTAAETSASITPTNFENATDIYDVRRVGIVPDSTGDRTANTTALVALLDPAKTGPVGKFIFPNVTGNTTYYFDDMVEIRDGCRLDLCGCTIDFTGTYEADDDLYGFFTFIRDVTIENGTINVAYDGSAGTNAGMVMRIGSRNSYPFGSDTDGIEDEDEATPMGHIALRNLRITSNNPGPSMMIAALGGLEGVVVENVTFDGQNIIEIGFYYEFGFYHFETTVANRTTSHAHNMHFRNVQARNLKSDGSEGAGISLIGAYNCTVDGLYVDGGYHAFEYRPGEALFYNVGAPYVVAGERRHIVLRNISGQNITNVGLSLVGAEAASGGYLSGEGLSEQQQTDLMCFSVDGFSFDNIGASVSGPLIMKNGTIAGDTSASGGIVIGDECTECDIDNVRILDGAGVGIRANIANGIWATPRLKIGQIRNCHIAGNTGAGIGIDNAQSVSIQNCRLGYHSIYDGQSETTQTSGVSVSTNGSGVVCDGNYVATASGTAYVKTGTGVRGCDIRNPRGEATASAGQWGFEGVAVASSTDIADVAASVNTDGKHLNKLLYDTSNSRLMIAQGPDATDAWKTAADFGAGDAVVTVTPS
jgi:hypothetical protein